jgi:hypothetical protein
MPKNFKFAMKKRKYHEENKEQNLKLHIFLFLDISNNVSYSQHLIFS